MTFVALKIFQQVIQGTEHCINSRLSNTDWVLNTSRRDVQDLVRPMSMDTRTHFKETESLKQMKEDISAVIRWNIAVLKLF